MWQHNNSSMIFRFNLGSSGILGCGCDYDRGTLDSGYGCGCGVFHCQGLQNQSVSGIHVQNDQVRHIHSTSCQNHRNDLGHGHYQLWLTAQPSIHSCL
uniref:Uncharacterized protein n=1 Tax=Oryza glumipatula TaxID=40148 RepID=A0A0D9YUT9_9ORYZ